MRKNRKHDGARMPSFITELEDVEEDTTYSIKKSTAVLSSSNYDDDIKKQDIETGFTMEIMMFLDTDIVNSLRTEFLTYGEAGLSVLEFVSVMLSFLITDSGKILLPSSSKNITRDELISNLVELFSQIDINGDKRLDWEEFTSFIVDTGLSVGATKDSSEPHDAIKKYQLKNTFDSENSTAASNTLPPSLYGIEKLVSIGENKIAVLDFHTTGFKLLSQSSLEVVRSYKSPTVVSSLTYLPAPHSTYWASTKGSKSASPSIIAIDEFSGQVSRSFKTEKAQQNLVSYDSSSSLLYMTNNAQRKNHFISGFNTITGQVVQQFGSTASCHTDIIMSVLPLVSLESIASGSLDRSVRIWDVQTSKCKSTLHGHEKGVTSVDYNPSYRFIITAGFDISAIVWNPYVSHSILSLVGHTSPLLKVKVVENTPQIITADISGVFKVWDIRTFGCVQTFALDDEVKTSFELKDFLPLPSKQQVVVANKTGDTSRQLLTYEYVKMRNPHLTDDFPISNVVYNRHNFTLITAAGERVKVWDARTGNLLKIFDNITTDVDVTTIVLDDRYRKFVTGDHDGVIRVWDLLSGSLKKEFNKHSDEVSGMVYIPECSVVVTSSWDGSWKIFDEALPESSAFLLRSVTNAHHNSSITALAVSYDLNLIATGGGSKDKYVVRIWDFEYSRYRGSCVGHLGSITALEFIRRRSSNCSLYSVLVVADAKGIVALWSMPPSKTTSFEPLYVFSNTRVYDTVTPITTMQTERNYLWAGDEQGMVHCWNLSEILKKQEVKVVTVRNPRRNINIDGKDFLHTIEKTDKIREFYNVSDSNVLFYNFEITEEPPLGVPSWLAHDDTINCIELVVPSSDSKIPAYVITASFDRRVKVWSVVEEAIHVGTLMQGCTKNSETQNTAWDFKIDFNARTMERKDIATSVSKKLDAMKRTRVKSSVFFKRRRSSNVIAPLRKLPSTTSNSFDAVVASSSIDSTSTTEQPRTRFVKRVTKRVMFTRATAGKKR